MTNEKAVERVAKTIVKLLEEEDCVLVPRYDGNIEVIGFSPTHNEIVADTVIKGEYHG